MDELISKIETIKTKKDFIDFIGLLSEDLKTNTKAWENKTLESFLEAMATWVEDMEWYYKNTNKPIPENVSWKIFADILMAARIYEI